MLELFTKKPIFQGNDEIHQLDVIYKVLGTLTSERWSGVSDLPWYELVKPKDATQNHFRTLFQKSVVHLWCIPRLLILRTTDGSHQRQWISQRACLRTTLKFV
jgi:hypothetical protein